MKFEDFQKIDLRVAEVIKEIVVVANLEPRKLMGFESPGMLLAANEDGKAVILIPEKKVAPGTKIF